MKATDNLNDLLKDFRKVANLAGVELPSNAIVIESLPAPHKQTLLPKDRFAVYVFNWKGSCLKVGKVGPRSQSRFTSQHYNPNSSASNLAKSILSHQEELQIIGISESNVGEWIRTHVDRVNILLDRQYGIQTLNLLESFLQCGLNPRFEGFSSQR